MENLDKALCALLLEHESLKENERFISLQTNYLNKMKIIVDYGNDPLPVRDAKLAVLQAELDYETQQHTVFLQGLLIKYSR